MRTWQHPERPDPAEWRCVRPHPNWPNTLSHWTRPTGRVAGEHLLISAGPSSLVGLPIASKAGAWLRRVDLSTLATWQREGCESEHALVDRCAERGWGEVLGTAEAPSPESARARARVQAKEWLQEPWCWGTRVPWPQAATPHRLAANAWPSWPTDRFVYDVVVEQVEAFAGAIAHAGFSRSWLHFRGVLALLAATDHAGEDHPLARAWEQGQVAFLGRGEALLDGAVAQLWQVLPDPAHRGRFREVLLRAFDEAERLTHPGVRRLYGPKARAGSIHPTWPRGDLDTAWPREGARLLAWAVDAGKDPEAVMSQMEALARAEAALTEPVGVAGGHLRLVEE